METSRSRASRPSPSETCEVADAGAEGSAPMNLHRRGRDLGRNDPPSACSATSYSHPEADEVEVDDAAAVACPLRFHPCPAAHDIRKAAEIPDTLKKALDFERDLPEVCKRQPCRNSPGPYEGGSLHPRREGYPP